MATNKRFKIGFDFSGDIDEAQLKKTADKIAALLGKISEKVDLVDPKKTQAAVQELQDMLQKALAGQESIPLTADTSAFLDEIQDVQSLVEELFQEVQIGGDSTTKQFEDDLQGAADAYERMKQELADAYNQHFAAAAKLAAEGKEQSEEYQQQIALLGQLRDQMNEVVAAEEKITAGLEKNTRAVQDTADNTEGLLSLESFQRAADFFGSIAEKGQEFRSEWKLLRQAVKGNAEELEVYGDLAEDVFRRGVGESASEAIKAATAARRFLADLTDDAGNKLFDRQGLEEYSVTMSNLGKTIDVEVGESFQKTRGFIKNFELDGVRAGNLVALAVEKGVTSSGDQLDVLAEFSGQFKEAQFSAEEYIGVLSRGGEEAAFNLSFIANAVKETNIRLTEGDVTATLNDAIANFGERFPTALRTTLLDVAKAGESGIKPTKEVILEMTGAVEQAFEGGQIDEKLRRKLQQAISGSPAEELGADLYGRLFGAPIDESLVRAQAEDAGKILNESMSPDSLVDSFSRGFDFIQQRAASAVAPLASGLQSVLTLAPQLQSMFNIAPGPIKTLLKSLGDGLDETLVKGGGAISSFVAKAVPLLKTVGSALLGPWGIAIAAVVAGLVYFFTQTEKGREIFDAIGAYVGAFVDNAVELLKGLGGVIVAALNPFDDIEVGAAVENLTKSVNKALKQAENDIGKSKIKSLLEEATTVKADLDKNNRIKELVEKFKNAKTEIEKTEFAKAIQDQVPQALDGIEQVTDKATGAVTTVYKISAEKALEYADAQEKALSKDNSGRQKEFVQLLLQQNAAFEDSKNRLSELGDAIVEGVKKGENVSDLQEQYKELEKEIAASRNELVETIKKGQDLGLVGDKAEDIAEQFGISKKEAEGLAGAMGEAAAAAKDAAQNVDALAKKFTELNDKAGQSVDKFKNAIGGLNVQISELQKKARAGDEEAEKQLKSLLEQRKKLQGDLNSAAREQITLQRQTFAAEQSIASIQEAPLAKAQRRYDIAVKNLETSRVAFELEQQNAVIADRREATARDELTLQTAQLQTLRDQLAEAERIFNVSRNSKGEIRVGIAFATADERRAVADMIRDLNAQIEQQQSAIQALRVQLEMDDKEFANQLRELRIQRIETNIELGLANRDEIIGELQTMQDEVTEFRSAAYERLISLQEQYEQQGVDVLATDEERNSRIIELQEQLATAKQEERAEIQRQLSAEISFLEQKRALTLRDQDLQQQSVELGQRIRDQQRQILDTRLAALDRELAAIDRASARETELLSGRIERQREYALAVVDFAAQQRAAVIDAEEAALGADLDDELKTRQEQLASYEKNLVLAAEDAEQARTAMEQEFAERREQAAAEFAARRQALEAQATGARLIAEADAAEKELAQQEAVLERQLDIARRKAQLAAEDAERDGATEEDRLRALELANAAADIEQQLSDIELALQEKSDSIRAVATDLQDEITDTLTNLFAGDPEAAKEPIRQIFNVLAGALKAEAAAAVAKIVFSWLNLDPSVQALPLIVKLGLIPGTQVLAQQAVNKILDPILGGLVSFSTGARVDSPTLAVVGDAAKLGSSNREWIFNDPQLLDVMRQAASQSNAEVVTELRALAGEFKGMLLRLRVSGSELLSVIDRTIDTELSRAR